MKKHVGSFSLAGSPVTPEGPRGVQVPEWAGRVVKLWRCLSTCGPLKKTVRLLEYVLDKLYTSTYKHSDSKADVSVRAWL